VQEEPKEQLVKTIWGEGGDQRVEAWEYWHKPCERIPKGLFIGVSVSWLQYLYQTTTAVTASGAGAATLVLRPMLRASPADNAALIVNPATVEGFVTVADGALGISVNRLVEGFSFTIEERL
jgi:hypothetical protein